MPSILSDIVEVCVFKNAGPRRRYLALKRSEDDALYPGIWQLVTGMIADDEHAAAAALREVGEETGLTALRLWRLPHVNSFYDHVRDVVHLCPNFAVEVAENSDPRLSSEHSSHEWCSLERAVHLLPWSGQRTSVNIVDARIIAGTDEAALLEIPLQELERKLE
ncbi:MAG: NUDIX domain-containing protein [Ignavibacterium sp.]|jgi:dATP pyrophosphohydrolase